jgi:hypothetical protein
MVWGRVGTRLTLCRATHITTGLPNYTMQTEFQSQRPSDVETPVRPLS